MTGSSMIQALIDLFGSSDMSLLNQQGQYSGSPISVPHDGIDGPQVGTLLTWDSFDGGVELLDRSDPEAPAVLVAGIYAVTAVIESSTALTSGGGLQGALHLDFGGLDAVAPSQSRSATSTGQSTTTSASAKQAFRG